MTADQRLASSHERVGVTARLKSEYKRTRRLIRELEALPAQLSHLQRESQRRALNQTRRHHRSAQRHAQHPFHRIPAQIAPCGRGTLSARQIEVVKLIAAGCSNEGIAERLVVTRGTAANHVQHILIKLGFSSRTQVAAWAFEHGLASPLQAIGRPPRLVAQVHAG